MTAMPLAWAAAIAPVPVQQSPPPNAPEFGGSSPVGLVVILLLFIAVFFLIRSMNKHLSKVPPSFEEQRGRDTAQDTAQDDSPPSGGPGPANGSGPSAGSG